MCVYVCMHECMYVYILIIYSQDVLIIRELLPIYILYESI